MRKVEEEKEKIKEETDGKENKNNNRKNCSKKKNKDGRYVTSTEKNHTKHRKTNEELRICIRIIHN